MNVLCVSHTQISHFKQCLALNSYLNDPAGQSCHLVLNTGLAVTLNASSLSFALTAEAHTSSGALRHEAIMKYYGQCSSMSVLCRFCPPVDVKINRNGR